MIPCLSVVVSLFFLEGCELTSGGVGTSGYQGEQGQPVIRRVDPAGCSAVKGSLETGLETGLQTGLEEAWRQV